MTEFDKDEERLFLASDTKDDEEYEKLLDEKDKKKQEKLQKKKEKEAKEKNKKPWQIALEYLKVILIGALIAFLLCKFVIINAVVPTKSMKPTINVDERLIGLRVPYYFSDPKRGDIVIFKAPEATGESGTLYIKRVIGLPGETIEVEDGKAYLVEPNGRVLLDSENWYNEIPNGHKDMVITLDKDEYFVMGDNRNNSSDSRVWGPVKRKAILAKAWLKYYKGFKFF